MSGYPIKPLIAVPVEVGASVTNQVLATFGVSGEGSRSLRLNLKAESTTLATAITVALRQNIAGTMVALASANASVSITTDGVYSIKLDVSKAADQVDMPLSKQLEVVITTGAGDSTTISVLDLLQAT